MKNLLLIILIVCLTGILGGCQHKSMLVSKKLPDDINAEFVINKVKEIIFSPKYTSKVNSVEYGSSMTKIGNIVDVKTKLNIKYYWEKPDKYKYFAERVSDTHSGKQKISTMECIKNGKKYKIG